MSGVVYLAGVTAVAAVVIAVFLYAPAGVRAVQRLGVRRGLIAPDPPVLPPRVERLARDLQRIRADLAGLDPHTPVARRRGVLAAYDDTLADACRAMGLVDPLADVPEGMDREVARLEVEELLVAAGLIPARTPGR
ncbi:hypothetical protein [Nocardioides sp. GXQ0305]|uniref:hypothetical protein n=1 Tax=Nocardioides sp. GXQ0305 TaxID=3423912 RepID=UPI003D7DC829